MRLAAGAAAWVVHYFDASKLAQNKMGICIAEVVGKGVCRFADGERAGGAGVCADGGSGRHACASGLFVLCGSVHDKFVTFFYGLLDGATGSLTYCNAGHLPPILIQFRVPLTTGGIVLGFSSDVEYEERTIGIERGHNLLRSPIKLRRRQTRVATNTAKAELSRAPRMCRDETALGVANHVLDAVVGSLTMT